MTIIQPGVANVSVEMQQAGLNRPAFITFGVDPTSGDPNAVASTIGGAIANATSLISIMDSTVTFKSVTVRLGQDGSPPLVGVHPMASTGTGGALSTLPPNCAVLIHKRTALGGRRGRGRMYLPWAVQEASVDEAGIIQAANVTQIQTAVSNFLSVLATANTPMMVLHDVGVDPTKPVPAATPVTSLTVDNLISTQRRRLGRR